jgi:hypothetical protein
MGNKGAFFKSHLVKITVEFTALVHPAAYFYRSLGQIFDTLPNERLKNIPIKRAKNIDNITENLVFAFIKLID